MDDLELTAGSASSASVDSTGADGETLASALSALVDSFDGLGLVVGDFSEDMCTYLANLTTLDLFILLVLLVQVGLLAALVFVVALRKL